MDKLTISGFNIYELRRAEIDFKTSMYALTKLLKNEKKLRTEKTASLVSKNINWFFSHFVYYGTIMNTELPNFAFLASKTEENMIFYDIPSIFVTT